MLQTAQKQIRRNQTRAAEIWILERIPTVKRFEWAARL